MRTSEEGVALMMVLWVLLLLSFIALEFAHSMRTEVEITKNYRDEIQAYYLARAGIEMGRYELAIAGKAKPHYTDTQTQRVVFGKGEDGNAQSSPKFRVFELGEGICDYRFEPANVKLPLNKLTKNVDALKNFLEKYCDLEAFSEEMSMIAYSIKDWVDDDDHYSLPGIGAEDDWYESNEQGYECKDADFDSVDELSLIRGLRIEDADSEEEIAKKKKMLANFKRFFGVNTGFSGSLPSISKNPDIILNIAGKQAIQVAYDIGLLKKSPDDVAAKKEENGGIYNDKTNNIIYYYINSTAIMNNSPVQRGIRASFFMKKRTDPTYWKPLYWNDNYIPEYYDDPNQDEFGQDDEIEE